MSLTDWQIALRRQYGRHQTFELQNIGDEPVFSEYLVTNPTSGRRYRVAIRGVQIGDNFCSCRDFETNQLGTCKHIEWLLGQLEADEQTADALARGFQPPYTEVFLEYGGSRRVRFRAGTDCPAELHTLAEEFFTEDDGGLPTEQIRELPRFLKKAAAFEHDLRCYDDVLNFTAEVRDQQTRRDHLELVYPVGSRSANLRGILQQPLQPYQREGALFAVWAGRCLLGDETGLGNRLQAVAAAEMLATEFAVERVLILAPAARCLQWSRDLSRWSGRSAGLLTEHTHGELPFFTIATFDQLVGERSGKEVDAGSAAISIAVQELAADLVILHEAQRIGDGQSALARCLSQLESPYAIALTGALLTQRLEQFVPVLQWIDRHRLGPTYRFLHEHQQHDENGKVTGFRTPDALPETLASIYLQRTRADVVEELPSETVSVIWLPVTENQRELHEQHRKTVERLLSRAERLGVLREPEQRKMLEALQAMRMSANSTLLVDRQTDESVKPQEIAETLAVLCDDPQAKVVVFSQWTRTLELIARRLKSHAQFVPENVALYHGGVTTRARKELVKRFRDDPTCRVFLSTDAGGVGLNLQPAAVVIHADLPWNPDVLAQRLSRVERSRREQPLQVLQFLSANTVEEGLWIAQQQAPTDFTAPVAEARGEVFLDGEPLQRFLQAVRGVMTATPSDRTASTFDLLSQKTAANFRASAVVARPTARESSAKTQLDADTKLNTAPVTSPGSPSAKSSPAHTELIAWLQKGAALLAEANESDEDLLSSAEVRRRAAGMIREFANWLDPSGRE